MNQIEIERVSEFKNGRYNHDWKLILKVPQTYTMPQNVKILPG